MQKLNLKESIQASITKLATKLKQSNNATKLRLKTTKMKIKASISNTSARIKKHQIPKNQSQNQPKPQKEKSRTRKNSSGQNTSERYKNSR
jgi:hypothetical protein